MSILEYGNFADGTIDGELRDDTQNWRAPYVTLLKDQGPNGGNAVRIATDDTVQLPNLDGSGQKHVRVHGLGVSDAKGGKPAWFDNDHEISRALSIYLEPGFDCNAHVVYDEIHGDNGSGPAPFNGTFQRGSFFREIWRGSTYSQANPAGGFPFEQNVVGPLTSGSVYDGQYYRHQQDWVGGNLRCDPGFWLNLRYRSFLSTDPNKGYTQAFARWGAMPAWLEIAPKKGSIRTSYVDLNGDAQEVYPMMSSYYDVGTGKKQAFRLAAGAYSDSWETLCAWQDKRLGLVAVPTPVAHPIHDAVAASMRAASKVSATTNPNIRAALDRSNDALGLLADEVEP